MRIRNESQLLIGQLIYTWVNEFGAKVLHNNLIWDIEKLEMSITTGNQQFLIATYAEKISQAKTTPKEFLDFLASVTKTMRTGAHPIDDPTTSELKGWKTSSKSIPKCG